LFTCLDGTSMNSRATYDQLQHELELLLAYNPLLLVPASKSASLCPKLIPPPSIFYDKHLDKWLMLKRVVPMPSITTRLAEVVDKILQSIQQCKINLPLYGPLKFFPTQQFHAFNKFNDPIIDAVSVA